VAAVAALVKSAHPRATPAQILRILKDEAVNPGCPAGLYDPDGNGLQGSACTGDKHRNSFYGFGIVNALAAVTH